jgi:hypothetical protein
MSDVMGAAAAAFDEACFDESKTVMQRSSGSMI